MTPMLHVSHLNILVSLFKSTSAKTRSGAIKYTLLTLLLLNFLCSRPADWKKFVNFIASCCTAFNEELRLKLRSTPASTIINYSPPEFELDSELSCRAFGSTTSILSGVKSKWTILLFCRVLQHFRRLKAILRINLSSIGLSYFNRNSVSVCL